MKNKDGNLDKLKHDVNERKVKMLEHQLLVQKFTQENELVFSEDGDVIIDCNLGSLSNIYSRYDMQKSKTLETQLHKYLLEETDIVPLYYTIQLNLHVFSNVTEAEELQARKAIQNHFSFAVARDNYILKNKLKIGRLLLLLGTLCLFSSALASSLNTVIPLYELLLILTWFFSWEGIGVLVFERNRLKSGMLNMLRLYNAKVVILRTRVPPKSIIMGPTGNQMLNRPFPPQPLATEMPKQTTEKASKQAKPKEQTEIKNKNTTTEKLSKPTALKKRQPPRPPKAHETKMKNKKAVSK